MVEKSIIENNEMRNQVREVEDKPQKSDSRYWYYLVGGLVLTLVVFWYFNHPSNPPADPSFSPATPPAQVQNPYVTPPAAPVRNPYVNQSVSRNLFGLTELVQNTQESRQNPFDNAIQKHIVTNPLFFFHTPEPYNKIIVETNEHTEINNLESNDE